MQPKSISQIIAKFNTTKNPFYLAKAVSLVLSQGRLHEVAYGVYCDLFCPPAVVKSPPNQALPALQNNFQALLGRKDHLSRAELIDIFSEHYAIHHLPDDFAGARIETIVYDRNFLIIGEYGYFQKRVIYVTPQSCVVNDYYTTNASVKHVHAIYKAPGSNDVLVTTGDTAKYLDLWSLQTGQFEFRKRLRNLLAGHTAITKIDHEYYLGSDFSSRPNYIEKLSGKKFFFPEKANGMFVLAFQPYQDRYIVSLNREILYLGGRHTLSVLDTVQEEYVYCDYVDYIAPETTDKALHWQAIAQRSLVAEAA